MRTSTPRSSNRITTATRSQPLAVTPASIPSPPKSKGPASHKTSRAFGVTGGQGQNRTVDTRIFNPRHCHIPPWPRERKVTGFLHFSSLPTCPPNLLPNLIGPFALARVEYRTGSTQCICRRRSWTDPCMPASRTWPNLRPNLGRGGLAGMQRLPSPLMILHVKYL